MDFGDADAPETLQRSEIPVTTFGDEDTLPRPGGDVKQPLLTVRRCSRLGTPVVRDGGNRGPPSLRVVCTQSRLSIFDIVSDSDDDDDYEEYQPERSYWQYLRRTVKTHIKKADTWPGSQGYLLFALAAVCLCIGPIVLSPTIDGDHFGFVFSWGVIVLDDSVCERALRVRATSGRSS